jgi:LCP family protein required for cell wall assembly
MRNKLLLFVIAVVFLLGGFVVVSFYQGDGPGEISISDNEYILFLGLDQFEQVRRTDTIIVAKLEENDIKFLSIPRDLRIKFPDSEFHKINAAYGFNGGNAELTRQLVSDLLGVPIHAYVVADYAGVTEFVDAVDGVEVNIPTAMNYSDSKQELDINFAAGEHSLDGSQAVEYLRYRDSDTQGDLGRIDRQQQFMGSLAEKLTRIQSFDQIQKLIQTSLKYVNTNLTAFDLVELAKRLQTFEIADISFKTLPGQARVIGEQSYFLTFPLETSALVEEYFHGREIFTNSDIRVVALNGFPEEEGRIGLAYRMNQFFVEQSFDVYAYWNADAFDYETSYLINISGNPEKEERVRAALNGIPVEVMTPEEFSIFTTESFEEDRLQSIRKMLLTTAVQPIEDGVNLNDADLLFIIGGGFPVDSADL